MSGLLLRGAEVGGELVDVRIGGGLVLELGRALPRRDAAEQVLAARGGALLPGLTDHHLHLAAAAADLAATACTPAAARTAGGLAAVLLAAEPDPAGWITGVRYQASVAGDLDAAALDRLRADVPVRIRHRSGGLWVLNSRAAAAVGLATADHPGVERDAGGRPTGRLRHADDWLRTRLPHSGPEPLAALGRRLADHGITSVTDAEPRTGSGAVAALAAACASGALPQRVQLLGVPPETALPPDGPTAGPWRIDLADRDTADPAGAAAEIAAAHRTGRPVAVHCGPRGSLRLLLAALGAAGVLAGDRIEHPELVPAAAVPEIARLGVPVVARPGFLAESGDAYLRALAPDRHGDLHRAASLAAAGVPLALSSDAPYGPLDPWAVMRAAVLRLTAAGEVLGAAERMTAGRALAGYLSPARHPGGRVRRVRAGAVADLVLLAAPIGEAVRRLDTGLVRLTLIGGRPVGGTDLG
ncbi:amidohydrolase family protein [Kitasatospora sp. NPDC059571]|uniref:amidohydrolase family protein n=1 Tax=Kitasatospora sp. NPDC059571 TaxID=3346871 RepID=UPI0036D0F8DA